ncbi:hypothetical protein BP6252_02836 [Coleophoma cylindrospora]|uniref:DUF1750-domain-containing protein n=1 Tax=Coleophoma cylindrospora TaxID=1849047 RepID=A0A3D8SG27_9HELO|nr:hypothetical protein BP6252_02836 [Coleophoma cylindrospora]
MQDPGYGVHRDLIQHVHLISTFRYPMLHQIHHEKVAQMLLQAPKIARDQAPFYWTYLDRPAAGTILLTWQPLSILGTDFASDGFIWAPAETAFQMEVNVDGGVYTLEMYHSKVGYAPGEQIAIHSRKRYRLLPGKFPSPSGQTPDPGLWIVHYSDVPQQERVPSNIIPIDMRTNTIMNTAQYLQSQGQIVQKEFMLHDRASWPQIQFPKGPQNRQPMYGGNMTPVRVPQQMAYPVPHPGQGPPPSKRPRTQNAPGPAAGPVGAILEAPDDDEDTSRGDLYDVISPRELSTERYKLNHLWMEEVINSPYALNQIIPQDLGLGLKGQLSALTEGIFDAPLDPEKDAVKDSYIGNLDAGKADEFRKRSKDYIAQTNKDIEKMKAKHAKRMEKFKKSSSLARAEKELRTAVDDPTDTGPEYWRLEGKIDEEGSDDGETFTVSPSKVDEILAQVEATLGRHTAAVKELQRIQDGGFEEAPVGPSPRPRSASRDGSHQSGRSGVLVGDADIDMGESSAAGLLDQYHTGLSATSTPGNASLNFPTPLPRGLSNSASGTPGNLNVPSPQPQVPAVPQQPHGLPMTTQPDVEMSNVTGTDPSGTGDWVVVPPGGVSPTSASAPAPAPAPAQGTTPQPAASTPALVTSAAATPGEQPTTTNEATPAFDADPNDFGDLGDLDTAGDALAEYHGGDGLGGDMALDMDMDDSAFGEAFHGVENRGVDGETAEGDTM